MGEPNNGIMHKLFYYEIYIKGTLLVGVINTKKWLEDHFSDPITICDKLKGNFDEDESENIYQYLVSFGMYKPTRRSKLVFEQLKSDDTWEKINQYFKKYKKKWNGPDIPIYIFPFQVSWRGTDNKSGVSFPDQLFLFIGEVEDDKELEALFIHEYHHVCRILYQKKKMVAYSLLDSMIMEGLAELAVKENCGEKYHANWCHLYEEEELVNYWEITLKDLLDVKKTEPLHDQLLYGLGRYPNMIGYCTGFYLVEQFHRKKNMSESKYFTIESEQFLPKK